MPWPVRSSVPRPMMNPIMARRPFQVSAKEEKPNLVSIALLRNVTIIQVNWSAPRIRCGKSRCSLGNSSSESLPSLLVQPPLVTRVIKKPSINGRPDHRISKGWLWLRGLDLVHAADPLLKRCEKHDPLRHAWLKAIDSRPLGPMGPVFCPRLEHASEKESTSRPLDG